MSIYDPLSEALGIEPMNNPTYLKIEINDQEIISEYRSVWTGKKHTEESKELIRQKALGRKRTEEWKISHSKMMTGKKHSLESRLKRSVKLSGSKNPMFGKKHTELSNQNRRMSTGHKIVIDDIVYFSRREAAKKIGVSRPTIDYWLKKGKAKMVHG